MSKLSLFIVLYFYLNNKLFSCGMFFNLIDPLLWLVYIIKKHGKTEWFSTAVLETSWYHTSTQSNDHINSNSQQVKLF